jgi:glycosyltransferase involved in cell wall biosynthesis
MKREPASAEPFRVVHVVGRVTDEVASFLAPATHVLARAGREQVVVMIDDLRHRPHIADLHDAVELVMAPARRNPIEQWRVLAQACRRTLVGGPSQAVHLHGLWPGLVGARAARAAGVTAPIFFSPHGSRSIAATRGMGALVLRAAGRLLGPRGSAAIVNVPHEAHAFRRWASAELVESPVGDVFFSAPRREARHPLVITGGRAQGARSAELLAQLAVLLSGEDLRIGFNWIGSVDEVSRVRLGAAGVSVFDVSSDAECASRLAAGWVYLASGGTRGFPLFLAEAMAAGLPCVALDVPLHREMIRDGETGYLCKTERDMIGRIATLIDDPALRAGLGQAARLEARRRFGESLFGAKLLAAYALPA